LHADSSDEKWDQRATDIIELREDDEPRAIFADLIFEDCSFCFFKSKEISIIIEEHVSPLLPDDIPDTIPDDRTYDAGSDGHKYMIGSVYTADDDHDVLSG
jgi:hypothetical protein